MPGRGRPQIISDAALLDAARSVFLEQGVGATTLAIAKKARISESVIFHRHKTKEALFLAVVEREARVPAALEAIALRAGKGAITEVLTEVGLAVVEQARAMMPFFMIASMMARAPEAPSARSVREKWNVEALRDRLRKPSPLHLRAVLLLREYFQREARLGRVRAVDFEALADVYLGALMHHAMQEYWWKSAEGALPPSTQLVTSTQLVASTVDVFVHGLLPKAVRRAKRRTPAKESA